MDDAKRHKYLASCLNESELMLLLLLSLLSDNCKSLCPIFIIIKCSQLGSGVGFQTLLNVDILTTNESLKDGEGKAVISRYQCKGSCGEPRPIPF